MAKKMEGVVSFQGTMSEEDRKNLMELVPRDEEDDQKEDDQGAGEKVDEATAQKIGKVATKAANEGMTEEERKKEAGLEALAEKLRGKRDKFGAQKYSEATIQAAIDAMRKTGKPFQIEEYEDEQRVLARKEMARQGKEVIDPNETFVDADEAAWHTKGKLLLQSYDEVIADLKKSGKTQDLSVLERQRDEVIEKLENREKVDESDFARTEELQRAEQDVQQDQEYWQKMAAMAAEAEANPGRWMSEEERAEAAAQAEAEASGEKREHRVRELWQKLKSRGGFKRVATAAVVLAFGGLLAFGNVATAQAGENPAVEAKGGENDVGGGETDVSDSDKDAGGSENNANGSKNKVGEQESETEFEEQTAEELRKLAESDKKEYSETDLEELGGLFYEGTDEREGAQRLENGSVWNLTEYAEVNADRQKNYFGKSREFLYDIEDKAERDAATTHEIIKMIRDQPQAMASLMANYPQLLESCGVDAEIVNTAKSGNVAVAAQGVLEALTRNDGDGALQKKMLGAMAATLANKDTQYSFHVSNDLQQTFYMYKIDGAQDATVDNVGLQVTTKQRQGAKQVEVATPFGTVTLNLVCGGQPSYNVEVGTPGETWRLAPFARMAQGLDVIPNSNPEIGTLPFDDMERRIGRIQGIIPGQPEHKPGEGEDEGEDPTPTPEEPGKPEPGRPDPTPEPEPTPGRPDPIPTPEPEPTPTPGVKLKDEEGEKKVVAEGGQTDPVDETSNVDQKQPGKIEDASNAEEAGQVPKEDMTDNLTGTYDKTDESTSIPGSGSEAGVTGGQVAESEESADQQETADQNEDLTNMTDDELAEWAEGLTG